MGRAHFDDFFQLGFCSSGRGINPTVFVAKPFIVPHSVAVHNHRRSVRCKIKAFKSGIDRDKLLLVDADYRSQNCQRRLEPVKLFRVVFAAEVEVFSIHNAGGTNLKISHSRDFRVDIESSSAGSGEDFRLNSGDFEPAEYFRCLAHGCQVIFKRRNVQRQTRRVQFQLVFFDISLLALFFPRNRKRRYSQALKIPAMLEFYTFV